MPGMPSASDAAPVLVAGGTGLLGQALCAALTEEGRPCLVLARRNADVCCDLTDRRQLERAVAPLKPGLIVNAAALTELALCEAQPDLARAINAQAALDLSELAEAQGADFVHISTDHFHTGGGDRRYLETDSVDLVNEYARSKYDGECLALKNPRNLVLRVNMAGKRGWAQDSFAEWACRAILARQPMRLFADAYASLLDAPTCARAILDLHAAGGRGLFQIGSSDCVSKAAFLGNLAKALGVALDWAEEGSVLSLKPRRAESLGMDIAKAQALLPYALPSSAEVAANLAAMFHPSATIGLRQHA